MDAKRTASEERRLRQDAENKVRLYNAYLEAAHQERGELTRRLAAVAEDAAAERAANRLLKRALDECESSLATAQRRIPESPKTGPFLRNDVEHERGAQ